MSHQSGQDGPAGARRDALARPQANDPDPRTAPGVEPGAEPESLDIIIDAAAAAGLLKARAARPTLRECDRLFAALQAYSAVHQARAASVAPPKKRVA